MKKTAISLALLVGLVLLSAKPAKAMSPDCSGPIAAISSPAGLALPETLYSVKIKDQGAVWIEIPAKDANAPATEFFLGNLKTVKAGTTFFHWGNPKDVGDILQDKQLTDANLFYRLLHGTNDDLEGGGFYMSEDPIDSASYGTLALAFDLSKDVQVVTSNWLTTRTDRQDIVLALRKAGIEGIDENDKPTWFNFDNNDALVNVRSLDKKLALSVIAAKQPIDQIYSLVVLDQKIPLSPDDWTPALLPYLKDLMLNKPLTADQKQTITTAVTNNLQHLIFFPAQNPSGQFNPTVFFNAINGVFAQANHGKSITDFFNSD